MAQAGKMMFSYFFLLNSYRTTVWEGMFCLKLFCRDKLVSVCVCVCIATRVYLDILFYVLFKLYNSDNPQTYISLC